MNKKHGNCFRLYVGISPNPYSRDLSIDGRTGGVTPLRGGRLCVTKYRTALYGLMGIISVDLYHLNFGQKLIILFCISNFNLLMLESTHSTQTMYCPINSANRFFGNDNAKTIDDFMCTKIDCYYIPPPN